MRLRVERMRNQEQPLDGEFERGIARGLDLALAKLRLVSFGELSPQTAIADLEVQLLLWNTRGDQLKGDPL